MDDRAQSIYFYTSLYRYGNRSKSGNMVKEVASDASIEFVDSFLQWWWLC